MNKPRTTTNPKKLRRARKIANARILSVDEVLHLHDLAIIANAPTVARMFLNMRGEVTEAEAQALLSFAGIEAAIRATGCRN